MKWPSNNNTFFGENVDFSHWQKQVLGHAAVFSARSQQRWLLFDADSYQFSVLFFALLVAKKSVVLPQNGQVESLKLCLKDAEAYAGSQEVCDQQVAFNSTCIVEQCGDIEIDEQADIRFYTSGSSGVPKAIDKKFNALLLEVKVLCEKFADQIDNTMVVATVSHQHIYGLLYKILLPLYANLDMCLQNFEYPEHLLHFITQNNDKSKRYTLISSPAYYHRLVQDNVLTPLAKQLSCCFSSGGPLQPTAANLLHEQFGFAPVEVLGSTETGGIAWRQQCKNKYWQAFDAIKLQLDEQQRLVISSPYVNDAQWYQTDDTAQILDEGCFILLGRADRVVKIEEKRCSLDEIMHRVNQHHYIDESYVLLLEHNDNPNKRNEIACVLALNPQGLAALEKLGKFKFSQLIKQHLKAYFEALVIPRKFRYLPALPFNSQGKLEKTQLEKLFD
ncbi:acyl-CoA synthetase [Pseudoalteromonas sp. MMG010]|uniref:AMP-binding protein n=1 Tax=Pseudoalteromonas sp. MMG010 TaxID=2822685 RepID=UPI001B3A0EC6|nr:AMP-binding protein [Pseudoalteromonas sp. MMG010]MBQ4833479.1 acyl-CoA synthetase [Pseudoalteromonas sp. MMG010]